VGNLAFDLCNNVVMFSWAAALVEDPGMASVPELLDNALVVYQVNHQAAWAEFWTAKGGSAASEPNPSSASRSRCRRLPRRQAGLHSLTASW